MSETERERGPASSSAFLSAPLSRVKNAFSIIYFVCVSVCARVCVCVCEPLLRSSNLNDLQRGGDRCPDIIEHCLVKSRAVTQRREPRGNYEEQQHQQQHQQPKMKKEVEEEANRRASNCGRRLPISLSLWSLLLFIVDLLVFDIENFLALCSFPFHFIASNWRFLSGSKTGGGPESIKKNDENK